MLLALALADHASDDGTRIYPKIKSLSIKTRQSVRTVQYQLRRMESIGWIQLVNAGDGGKGMSREYRISEAWIKGAVIASIETLQTTATKGANDDAKGCNELHPQNNHQYKHEESSIKYQRAGSDPSSCSNADNSGRALSVEDLIFEGCDRQSAKDWLAIRGRHKPVTLTVWRAVQREAAKAGLSVGQAVEIAAERSWRGFKADWYVTPVVGKRFGEAAKFATQQDKRDDVIAKFAAMGEIFEAH